MKLNIIQVIMEICIELYPKRKKTAEGGGWREDLHPNVKYGFHRTGTPLSLTLSVTLKKFRLIHRE
jgi:hypothetical protein